MRGRRGIELLGGAAMSEGVLFVCTANAYRSQMAEGIARRLLPASVGVFSGGTRALEVDPRAVKVMAEIGVDIGSQRAKAVSGVERERFDRIVTLCDDAAEHCPATPDKARAHWPTPDPARAEGSPDAVLQSFRSVRDALTSRIAAFAETFREEAAIGVIGGSGFYDFPALTHVAHLDVETPFGPPSGRLTTGRFHGRRVVFLARHGEGHRLLPSEVNVRANIYAMKRLGVTKLVSVSAVGSLRDEIAPGHVVTPRQFIDRTNGRPSTFFGDGVVAHVSLADAVCPGTADVLVDSARALDTPVHPNGTYVCIEGPQFSTRAESALSRSWGADVVGMTNLPEARLAREAEICYATLVLPTDYDCWRTRDEEVRVADVLSVLRTNVETARRVLAHAIERLDPAATCRCQHALDAALVTPCSAIDARALVRLYAILCRRLRTSPGPQREDAP